MTYTINNNLITWEQLYSYQEQLEGYAESKMLEYFMAWRVSMDWDREPVWQEVYKFLLATMYYDEYIGCWLVK